MKKGGNKIKSLGDDGDLDSEMMEIGRNELNKIKYSKNLKQQKKARGKGGRGYSPWWYLEDRVLATYYKQSEAKFEDYPVNKFVHFKRGKAW